MDISSLTIDEFLARLGSSDPTPGGGALAAVSGAMAAAMLAMVCNLTSGRPRYAHVEAQVRDILTQTLAWQQRLIALANADADAYLAVRDAYRLPRSTEAEREARAEAIEQSMRGATEVPVETAEAARKVLHLAFRSAEITNVTTLGDVATAAHLAVAAARAAADQARLNLLTVHDAEFAAAMVQRIELALADAESVLSSTLENVQARASEV